MRFAETAEVVAYGCDISDVALELARTQLSTSRFSLCDGDHLPFGDNQFEYVTNLGSLEHFLSPEHGARDMARVVKADGVVCVLLPNKYRLYEILHVMRTGYESPQNQDLERFAAVNDWRDMLNGSGLRVFRVYRSSTFLTTFHWLLVRALAPFNLSQEFVCLCRKG